MRDAARLGAERRREKRRGWESNPGPAATRHLARTARADPRRDASRAHHRAVPVGTARGRGRFARVFTEGNDGEIAREFVEVALASVASTAFARAATGLGGARGGARGGKGEVFGESPEKPPPRFRTVFVGTPAGTSARTSRRMSFAARRRSRLGSTLAGSRGRQRLDGDSDRPAARRSRRSRDRRWCPRRSAARRFAGFARRRFEWLGRGWSSGERQRRGWRRRRRRGVGSAQRRGGAGDGGTERRGGDARGTRPTGRRVRHRAHAREGGGRRQGTGVKRAIPYQPPS